MTRRLRAALWRLHARRVLGELGLEVADRTCRSGSAARIATVVLLAFVAVVWCGCSDPLGIDDPLELTDVREATADQVAYARVQYASVEACLGLTGDVDRVVWKTAAWIVQEGKKLNGVNRADTVYVRHDYAQVVRDHGTGEMNGIPFIWRHESMHHILRVATGDGDPHHRDGRWSCAFGAE